MFSKSKIHKFKIKFDKFKYPTIEFQGYTYSLDSSYLSKFKYEEFLPGIFIKVIFNNIYIKVLNNLDNIQIFDKGCLIFANFKSKNYEYYNEYKNFTMNCKYTLSDEGIKKIDIENIIYPDTMGGDGNRCSCQNIFRSKLKLYNYNSYYEFCDILTMCETSQLNPKILSICKNGETCSQKIMDFKDDDSNLLTLIELNGKFFLNSDGAHRICAVKKSNKKVIRAKIKKINKIDNGISKINYYSTNMHTIYDAKEVVKDFYNIMGSFGIDRQESIKILKEPVKLHNFIDSYNILN